MLPTRPQDEEDIEIKNRQWQRWRGEGRGERPCPLTKGMSRCMTKFDKGIAQELTAVIMTSSTLENDALKVK